VLEGLAARLFAEQAPTDMVDELQAALDDVVAASKGGDGDQALDAKTRFYDVLYKGGASETLGAMLGTVRARVWQWRAVGLTHPRRGPSRLRESIANLQRLVDAIRAGNGDAAEAIARDEVGKAAAEVMRLVAAESTGN